MSRLTNYIRDTKGELRHVSWPTQRQSMVYTVVVIIVSILVAAYLGFFDYLFSLMLQKLVL